MTNNNTNNNNNNIINNSNNSNNNNNNETILSVKNLYKLYGSDKNRALKLLEKALE